MTPEPGWISTVIPHTEGMRLEERWRRVGDNTLELTLTLFDPEFYTEPWMSEDEDPGNAADRRLPGIGTPPGHLRAGGRVRLQSEDPGSGRGIDRLATVILAGMDRQWRNTR